MSEMLHRPSGVDNIVRMTMLAINERNRGRIPVAKDRPNPYLMYRSLKRGEVVPDTPLKRYESSRTAYTAYKYALPAMLLAVYVVVGVVDFRALHGLAGFSFVKVFANPLQIAAILIFLPVVKFVSLPLSHVIVCEEGLFIRSHTGRFFVPWKYLRSYHQGQFFRPWTIGLTYYVAPKKYVRLYTIASVKTEHETRETLNFIYKARHSEDEKPVQV